MSLVPMGSLSLDNRTTSLKFTPEIDDWIGLNPLLEFCEAGIHINRDDKLYSQYTSKDVAKKFKEILEARETDVWGDQIEYSINGKWYVRYDVKRKKVMFNHTDFPSIVDNADTFTYWTIHYIER